LKHRGLSYCGGYCLPSQRVNANDYPFYS